MSERTSISLVTHTEISMLEAASAGIETISPVSLSPPSSLFSPQAFSGKYASMYSISQYASHYMEYMKIQGGGGPATESQRSNEGVGRTRCPTIRHPGLYYACSLLVVKEDNKATGRASLELENVTTPL